MKIAVIGSRGITAPDLDKYITDCDEIVSGGAKGVVTYVKSEERRFFKREMKAADLMDNARSLGARRSYLRQVQGTGVGFDVRAVSSLCPPRFKARFEKKTLPLSAQIWR